MVRQALLFDLKRSICHAIQRLLRKIDYNGNFFKPVVGLISSTRVHMMTVGRFEVSVLRPSLPAVLSMSVIQTVIQPIEPTSHHVKKRMCIPGYHVRVSFVYFGFYFHLVNLFCFLGKLTTGRPWPTPWPRPWPTPGFVPTPYMGQFYEISIVYHTLYL